MKYRECGTSGLKLSVMGIGCWSYGGGAYWGEQAQSDVDAVINDALDQGINFFDTAEGYNDGNSEIALGQALRSRRSEAIIGTKVFPANCKPDTLREHCEASLKRLGTDYLDIYTIHWPLNQYSLAGFEGDPPTLPEAVRTMEDLQKKGKVRYLGVSNFGKGQMDELRAISDKFVVNQLPYSLLFKPIEPQIVPYCKEHQIGIVGYMALMQGVLTGKFHNADAMPPSRTRVRHYRGDREGSRHGGPGSEKETFETVDKIREITNQLGVPMHLLSIAWSLANPQLTSTLVGARNVAQLRDNLKAMEIQISPETMAALNQATTPLLEEMGPSIDMFEHSDRSRSW